MQLNPIRLFQDASEVLFGAAVFADRTASAVQRPKDPGFVPRPPGMTAKEYEAYQLFALGEAGVTNVRLRAPEGIPLPPSCAENDGTVMTLDEAMIHRPIPHPPCGGQECRCSYRPA